VPYFEIIGEIREVAVIASGGGVRRAGILRERYGGARWRKLKGVAAVIDENGEQREAEVHWYESHGVGRKGFKIKRFLD
jgi:hypothetical protein